MAFWGWRGPQNSPLGFPAGLLTLHLACSLGKVHKPFGALACPWD